MQIMTFSTNFKEIQALIPTSQCQYQQRENFWDRTQFKKQSTNFTGKSSGIEKYLSLNKTDETYFFNSLCYSAWVIATLGSILDSQLSWESGKFQLARWSHEVVLFPERTTQHKCCATDPPTHSPNHMDFLDRYFVRCPHPINECVIKFSCAVSPPPLF